MSDHHQILINQYNEIKSLQKKSQTKTIILEILVVAIVCCMKAFQHSTSVAMNAWASAVVTLLLIWHFWDFKSKRDLDRRTAELVLEGVELEKAKPFLKPSFFHDYLKEFNVLGEMAGFAIFDFAFLYFFSVSVTQLIKSINPEIVAKLMPSTPIRTFLISAFLGWMYYMPLRPIAHLKKELQGSWV
jgi:hypothetical protein